MVLLIFVAAKLTGNAFDMHISNAVSLAIIGTVIGSGIIYSQLVRQPEAA